MASDSGKASESMREAYRELAPFMTIGLQLALTVIAFYFVGYWADQKFATSPLCSLIGIALGMIGGFVKLFRSVAQLNRRQQASKEHQNKKSA